MGLVDRNRRALRDALILIGLFSAAVYFVVQDIHPWTFIGIDARAYWRVDLAHPYANSGVGDYSTYLYSPAFAQFLSPLYVLPFEAFFVLWTIASIAVLYWLVRPWPWALLILFLPWTYELFVGQVHLFIAAAIVLGFRYPALWAFNILTKVTPGHRAAVVPGSPRVAGARHRARHDAGDRGRVVRPRADRLVRLVRVPAGSTGSGELLYARIAAAAVIVVAGALTDRRWAVPIAVWLALPVVWIESWVILLAIIRLRDQPAPDAEPAPVLTVAPQR